MVDPIFSPTELAEVQAYYAPYYFLAKINEASGFLISVLTLRYFIRPAWRFSAWAAAGLGQRFARVRTLPVLRALFKSVDLLWSGPGWGAALLFALSNFALETVIGLPQDIYFGYFHEHRFGMSNLSPGQFAWDSLKGSAIGVVALGALTFGLFGLVRKLKRWWLILAAVGAVMLLGSAALDPYRARVFFDQTPLPAGPLRDQITALMAKANVDFKDVLVEKTSRASVRVQAYFAGRGPTRTIVLNDQLLKSMKEDEVLAAVAHEAGHVHEPRWPSQVASTLALFGFLFLVDRLLKLTFKKGWFGVTEVADIRALPLILTVFWTLFTFIRPVTGAISREREREADRYGVALTQNPDAFRRMLIVACRVNKTDPDPPLWSVLKGKSHPSFRERLEALDPPTPP